MSTIIAYSHAQEGLRNLHGRGMNKRSELYKLPSDVKEMDRLSLQHRIWKLMVGGLYPAEAEESVAKALRLDEGSSAQPAILDIGSGSGIWAIEMAQKFPHVKVVGIDLAESKPGFVPSNCSFLAVDATKGMEDLVGQFNIVQCRSVAGHVEDPVALTRSIGRCLKSGGVFLFADANKGVFTADRQLCQPAPFSCVKAGTGESWFARWMYEVVERWTSKGHQKSEGDKLNILVREDSQYEFLGERRYWSPVNWDGGDIQNGREIGKLMIINAHDFLQSSRPTLLTGGFSEATVDSWLKNVQREILDPSFSLLMKWVVVWAAKKEED